LRGSWKAPSAEDTEQPLAASADRFNGNTRLGRRIRKQYRAYVALMGLPSDLMSLNAAAAAAELFVAVEVLRVRLLAGEDCEESLTRLTNIQHQD
jgi:hypothetical protein